jgi:hypothetical protein
MREFVEHYHGERNLQGLGNELINRVSSAGSDGGIRRVGVSAGCPIIIAERREAPRRVISGAAEL